MATTHIVYVVTFSSLHQLYEEPADILFRNKKSALQEAAKHKDSNYVIAKVVETEIYA